MADLGNTGTLLTVDDLPPFSADGSTHVYHPPPGYDLSNVGIDGGQASILLASFGSSESNPSLFKVRRGGVWVDVS